ncbi:hypothetical protein WMY93_029140 [Mugilogobius chulae]|uniref:HTH psq-type domain-containing protein n=1 Tax=Mugilogobius chulae TaxID=88201 RepID=A0AAW0MUT2_9GOBI
MTHEEMKESQGTISKSRQMKSDKKTQRERQTREKLREGQMTSEAKQRKTERKPRKEDAKYKKIKQLKGMERKQSPFGSEDLEAVQAGRLSYRQAAAQFGVPKSTLSDLSVEKWLPKASWGQVIFSPTWMTLPAMSFH